MFISARRANAKNKTGRPLSTQVTVARFPLRYPRRLLTNPVEIGLVKRLIALKLAINLVHGHPISCSA